MKITLALGALLLCCSAAMADTVTFDGETTLDDPTWNRPISGSPPGFTSLSATDVSYDVFRFSVSASGLYTLVSAATGLWDNFTVLYENAFDPLSPLTNAIVANDDLAALGESGFTLNLAAGTTYFLVTTGFGNDDRGTYTNTITGIGEILVPEPATLALAGAALAALALVRRRARQ